MYAKPLTTFAIALLAVIVVIAIVKIGVASFDTMNAAMDCVFKGQTTNCSIK